LLILILTIIKPGALPYGRFPEPGRPLVHPEVYRAS
jgi:hypothetical protein